MSAPASVRPARGPELALAARLQHAFNREFGDPVPDPGWLAARFETLLRGGDTEVLVIGEPVSGFAVLRFRAAIFIDALECYLAELYVVPERRGRGLGRALMEGVLACARERGAGYIDLNTDETDVAARALYESLGFTNTGGRAGGPRAYYYELEL